MRRGLFPILGAFAALAALGAARGAGAQSLTFTQVPPLQFSGTSSQVILDYSGSYGVTEDCDQSGFGFCNYIPFDFRYRLGTLKVQLNRKDRTTALSAVESESCISTGPNLAGYTCTQTGHAVGTIVGYDVPGVDTLSVALNGLTWGKYGWTGVLSATVAATPGTITVGGGQSSRMAAFSLTNSGSSATRFLLEAVCTGAGILSSPACAPTMREAYVPAGATVPLAVAFNSAPSASSGSVTLRAVNAYTSALVSNSSVAVTVTAPPLAIVSVPTFQRGTNFERALCPTFALVPGVAAQCGAARVAHALPTVRTFGKSYTPTLAYYGDQVRGANVTTNIILPATTSIPDSVQVKVCTINTFNTCDPSPPTFKYAGSAWSATRAMRVSTGELPIPPLTDGRGGILTYEVEVQIRPAGSSWTLASPPVRGQVAVANRKLSGLGNGWAMLGIEQLVTSSGLAGALLWIDGDGSTRKYTQARVSGVTTVYGAASLDRPDSLYYRSDSNEYRRALPHGANVYFDNLGRHVRTVNRFGRATTFTYEAGAAGRLLSMMVPGGLIYQLSYGTGTVVTVTVNGKVVQLLRSASGTTWLVNSIVDPDGSQEGFGYTLTGSGGAALTGWSDRRNTQTAIALEAGLLGGSVATTNTKVVQPPLSGVAFDSIYVTTLSSALGRTSAPSAVDSMSSADYRIDGPRTDVSDVALMWVDTLGAVGRTRDATGREVLIEHGDPRFPTLPTRVVNLASGYDIRSSYDAQGRMLAKTQINPHDDGRDAVSVYAWDPTWDELTFAQLPEGEASKFGVDPVTGNRTTEESAHQLGSQIKYRYNAQGLVRAVELPATGGAASIDSVVSYDAFGNVTQTRSPLGSVTQIANDVFGRVVAVRGQITAGDVNNWTLDSTVYDALGRGQTKYQYGPAMNGAPAQATWLRNFVSLAGNLDSTVRDTWSSPVQPGDAVSHLKNAWGYDGFGRVLTDSAPDHAVDSSRYDLGSNLVRKKTRVGSLLVYSYDALGRPVDRVVPARFYGARSALVCRIAFSCTTDEQMPQFALSTASAVSTPGYTTHFDYDATTGAVQRAQTIDAESQRTYDRSGTLKTETEIVRSAAGALYTTSDPVTAIHAYTTSYQYDRNGRVLALTLPWQLQPRTVAGAVLGTQVQYSYDPATGAIATITDPLGQVSSASYNARGDRTAVSLPGATIAEVFDAEGALRRSVANSTTGIALRSDTLTYDARGKLLASLSSVGAMDTARILYDGMGHIASSASSSLSVFLETAYRTTEVFKHSPLGDLLRDTTVTNLSYSTWGGWLQNISGNTTTTVPRLSSYDASSGRVLSHWARDNTEFYDHDASGNRTFTYATSTAFGGSGLNLERANYFDAAGLLRATEMHGVGNYTYIDPTSRGYNRVFEEYGYDAFGRRVWVRTRRECYEANFSPFYFCGVSTLRRVIWDRQVQLGEIQQPGQSDATAAIAESDAGLGATQGAPVGDPNPFFGATVNVHGLFGTDRPHEVLRMFYQDRPSGGSLLTWQPFTVSLLWNSRGVVDAGVYPSGTQSYSQYGRQHTIATPNAWFAYQRARYFPFSWHGSLLDDKRDGTGMVDRRNRSYDPRTGRFTQEDPIGLAGGMNVYGFADGDPVSYSDPFGLCIPWPSCANDYWDAAAIAGHTQGGVLGSLKAAGSVLMGSLIEGFGINQADRGMDLVAEGRPVMGAAMVGLAVVGNLPGGNVLKIEANLARTVKAAQGAEVTATALGGFTRATWTVPGASGGAARTVWNKIINSEGKTIRMYHDSYDAAGVFQHRKFKVPDTRLVR